MEIAGIVGVGEISMEKYVVGLDVRKEFRRGRTSITYSSRLLHSLKIS